MTNQQPLINEEYAQEVYELKTELEKLVGFLFIELFGSDWKLLRKTEDGEEVSGDALPLPMLHLMQASHHLFQAGLSIEEAHMRQLRQRLDKERKI